MTPAREFFATRTVADALAGFRPARRTPIETVALAEALERVPAEPVTAPHDLPGFARATVDGYAVRAADTYGASEGLPSYLDVAGAVAMGRAPEVRVSAGRAVAIPTGAVLPEGADAVVMVEDTQVAVPGEAGGASEGGAPDEAAPGQGGAADEAAPGQGGAADETARAATIEVLRPVAPGDGIVRADEDAAAGAQLAPAGRPLRPADLGLLAAAGVTRIAVHARPRVAILSTGDEVVDPATPTLGPGQVRDATAVALAALVRRAGGEPVPRGIVPDDRAALQAALAAAVAECDVVVVSAGSSVGARDETAAAVAGLGPPGIWCHGLAIKPGKPTLLADCGGVPLIGLPGNPRSALVVFGVVGAPVVRRAGGCTDPPPAPTTRAVLARDLPSAAGRLDVVPVRVRDGVAEPLFGASALLSVLTAADGHIVIDEPATGLPAGTDVEVVRHG